MRLSVVLIGTAALTAAVVLVGALVVDKFDGSPFDDTDGSPFDDTDGSPFDDTDGSPIDAAVSQQTPQITGYGRQARTGESTAVVPRAGIRGEAQPPGDGSQHDNGSQPQRESFAHILDLFENGDPQTAVDWALARSDNGDWPTYLSIALHRWATIDPAAALTHTAGLAAQDAHAALVNYLGTYFPEALFTHAELVDTALRGDAITRALRNAARADPDAAKGLVETFLTGSEYDRAMQVVDGLAERYANQRVDDPAAAIDAALAITDPRQRGRRLGQVMRQLVKGDPMRAVGYYERLPAGAKLDNALSALVNEWAKTDPRGATDWLMTLDDPNATRQLSMSARAWAQEDFTAADQYSKTLEGQARSAFLVGIAWGSRKLPLDEAIGFLDSHRRDPAFAGLSTSILNRWANEAPQEATAFVNELPEATRLMVYQSIVPGLMRQGVDTVEAFLEKTDDARVTRMFAPSMAGQYAQSDPDKALEWLEVMPVGRQRDETIQSLAASISRYDLELAEDTAARASTNTARQRAVVAVLQNSSEAEMLRIAERFGIPEALLDQVKVTSPFRPSRHLFQAIEDANQPVTARSVR